MGSRGVAVDSYKNGSLSMQRQGLSSPLYLEHECKHLDELAMSGRDYGTGHNPIGPRDILCF